MEIKIQNLDKLTKQEISLREILNKLELDIKISKATQNHELTAKYRNEELGLEKLLSEIKIEKIELSNAIEIEQRQIKAARQIELDQANAVKQKKYDEHIEIAHELHRDGQIKICFGVMTLIGGSFFFNTSVVLAILIILCGFVLIGYGMSSSSKAADEMLYAKGFTKDQVAKIRRDELERKREEIKRRKEAADDFDRKYREEESKNEKLAKAIAKELKK